MDLFFWITSLIIPFIMILMGLIFILRPPKKINSIYGYRTGRSMASQEAWNFAHATGGRVWLVLGPVLAAVTVIIKLTVPLQPEVLELIITGVGLVCLIAPIPYVESQLKKKFGK